MPGAEILNLSVFGANNGNPNPGVCRDYYVHAGASWDEQPHLGAWVKYATPGFKTVTITAYACYRTDETQPFVKSADVVARAVWTFNVQPGTLDPGPCARECESSVGMPINLANGNVWISNTDYSVPGYGDGLTFTRVWNSLWKASHPPVASGLFGPGWTSAFEERLQDLHGTHLRYWTGSGNASLFDAVTGAVVAPAHERATLTTSGGEHTLAFPDGTAKVFSVIDGRLLRIQNRRGTAVTVNYDTSGRLSSLITAGARFLGFQYELTEAPGLVTALIDQVGVVASFEYTNGRLTRATYADGSQHNYHYDQNDAITSVTDSAGVVIETHTYDDKRRGLTSAGADGVNALTVEYGENGSVTIRDSQNRPTIYTYTDLGGNNYLIGINGPGCSTCGERRHKAFAVDAAGNRTSSTDLNNNVTTYTHDAAGNVLTKVDAAGTWTFTYNSFGQVLTAKDPLNQITTKTYNTTGDLTSVTTPSPDGTAAPSVTSYEYDAAGQLGKIIDPNGNATLFAYDYTAPGFMLAQVSDDASTPNATTFTYDTRGNRLSTTDALSQQTVYEYDAMNRVMSVTYSDTSSERRTYDLRGRLATTTDAKEKQTTFVYDANDRLLSVTKGGRTIEYTYDSESNLSSVKDPNGRVTTFTYDGWRRLIRTTFPSTLFETYEYDGNGNMTRRTDRKNQAILYEYDAVDRLVRKEAGTNVTTLAYDAASRLQQASDATGLYGFAYDNMGRVTQTTVSYSFLPTSWGAGQLYDKASNRVAFRDVIYGYQKNRPTSVLLPHQQVTVTFSYDAIGRRTSSQRPSGQITYDYTPTSNLLAIGRPTGLRTTYTVDPVGNRSTRTVLAAGGSTSLEYDDAYQLTAVKNGAQVLEAYTYDFAGNRLSDTGGGLWTYDVSNRLTAKPGVVYTYDNNGNMASRTDASGTTTYSWDAEDRLTGVSGPTGTVSFTYDPFGRRIRKSTASATTIYMYDGDNVVEELNAAGTSVARYLWVPHTNDPIGMRRAFSWSFYETDGQGSVLAVGISGVPQATYSYDAFGNLTASSGTLVNPLRYAGGYFDTETGLYIFGRRYYDPSIGRFLSEDPVGFAGGDTNLYRYVSNNPTNLVDPAGESLWSATSNFVKGALSGAASVIAVGAGVASGTIAGGALAVGVVGVGAYQGTIALQELILGVDPYTGAPLTSEQRIDVAAGLAGGVVGGGAALRPNLLIRPKGEFWIGSCRIAPLGNRTPIVRGRLPHYHRGRPDPMRPGASLPDQGMPRHRPWEGRPTDRSWRDRF